MSVLHIILLSSLIKILCFAFLCQTVHGYDRYHVEELEQIRHLLFQYKLNKSKKENSHYFNHLKSAKFNEIKTLLQIVKKEQNDPNSSLSTLKKINKIKSLVHELLELQSIEDASDKTFSESYLNESREMGIENDEYETNANQSPESFNLNQSVEFKIGYGLTFPMVTSINKYDLEFSTGHFLDLSIIKSNHFFYWGGHACLKYFDNNKINLVPILGSIETEGSNRVLNFAACSGVRNFFTNRLFAEAQISGGVAFSKYNVTIANTSIHSEESDFYWSLGSGIGYSIDRNWSIILKYQIDGHSNSFPFGYQIYNQVWAQIGASF